MCQKIQFFNFLKSGDSVMGTLHLLLVFVSIVENFTVSQKMFPDRSTRIYIVGIFLESYPYQEIKFSSWQFFACSHKCVLGISSIFEGRHYNR